MESAEDIAFYIGWDGALLSEKKSKSYGDLSILEQTIVNTLRDSNGKHIDLLTHHVGLDPSELAMILLELEFRNIVQALPGKQYRLA